MTNSPSKISVYRDDETVVESDRGLLSLLVGEGSAYTGVTGKMTAPEILVLLKLLTNEVLDMLNTKYQGPPGHKNIEAIRKWYLNYLKEEWGGEKDGSKGSGETY